MATSIGIRRADDDNYLNNLSKTIQKRLNEKNLQKGKMSHAMVWKTLTTVVSWTQYNTSYNYITCVCNIMYNFPKIISLKTAQIFNEAATRMNGIMKTKQSNIYKMNTIEKIAKMLFSHLLQYTGANMVIMNITEEISEVDIYDIINDSTPVIFTFMISPKTALIGCLHDEKAKLLAKKCNNCVMMSESHSMDGIQKRPRIKCLFIETKQIQRQKCFNWGSKTAEYNYHNSAMNITLPLSNIIEYSSMMKSRS